MPDVYFFIEPLLTIPAAIGLVGVAIVILLTKLFRWSYGPFVVYLLTFLIVFVFENSVKSVSGGSHIFDFANLFKTLLIPVTYIGLPVVLYAIGNYYEKTSSGTAQPVRQSISIESLTALVSKKPPSLKFAKATKAFSFVLAVVFSLVALFLLGIIKFDG